MTNDDSPRDDTCVWRSLHDGELAHADGRVPLAPHALEAASADYWQRWNTRRPQP